MHGAIRPPSHRGCATAGYARPAALTQHDIGGSSDMLAQQQQQPQPKPAQRHNAHAAPQHKHPAPQQPQQLAAKRQRVNSRAGRCGVYAS